MEEKERKVSLINGVSTGRQRKEERQREKESDKKPVEEEFLPIPILTHK